MLFDYDTLKNNFGALPEKFSNSESSAYFILPVPYDQTVSYRTGTRNGPQAIINASRYLELFDNTIKRNIYKKGIYTMDEVEPVLSGPLDMLDRLNSISSEVLLMDKYLITIGGEHSISLAPVKAYLNKFKKLSIIHMDAHSDMRDSYCGTKYGHGSVMKRIRELTEHTVHIGIRSFSEEEYNYIKEENIDVYYAEDIYNNRNWYADVISKLQDNVYITFDLDVFDPSIMPSVGTPEPGGLSWYDVDSLLKGIWAKKKIVGFDIVELSPISDNVAPDFLAAKLIYKIIGYSLEKDT